MTELLALWLPILVCSIVLWFASFIAWAVSPHHKPDYIKHPDEEKLLEFVRSSNAKPGQQYLFPHAEHSELKDEAVIARYKAGPWGVLNIWPGEPNMGANMVKTFLFFVVTSFFIAYLTQLALDPGEGFSKVFQISGTAGILAYCFAPTANDIWFEKPKRAVLMNWIDGIIFGLLTGVVFGMMWPAA